MKSFCFTVDDNIRFLKEITERKPKSIFEHPYLCMMRRLHERFGVKIQLNLFWCMPGFDLSMTDGGYASEWQAASDWLKLSFHSRLENVRPYQSSGYDEVFADLRAVNGEILRFAGKSSLADTTTVHYCQTTDDGNRALSDCGVKGLLGLFGTSEYPGTSYSIPFELAEKARQGELVSTHGMTVGSIDLVINTVGLDRIEPILSEFTDRPQIRVMIHEQYFYGDYKNYQPDFEEKLALALGFLAKKGYESRFFEEMI